MNRGQRLKQKKHREALERAKYITNSWDKIKKEFTGKVVRVTELTRIRL
jgi:hypothetical protein